MQPIPQINPQAAGNAPSMVAMVSATTLAEVLARPDIWRGDALAKAPRPTVSTGFAALDAELPGGGWPRGAVVEVMSRHSGIGEMALLMPALAAQFADSNTGWTICVAPPLLPFAPGWAPGWGSGAHSIALQRLMVIRARGEDAAWACARALDTEGVGAVLAWLPNSRAATMRRLQLLAERSEALVFVFRPCACATQSSPAPLRLMLTDGLAGGGEAGISRSTASRLRSGSAVLSRDSTPSATAKSCHPAKRSQRHAELVFARPSCSAVVSEAIVATPRSGVKGMQSSSAPTGKTLAVHLIKRRGAGRAEPLYLNVPRPRREVYELPCERVSSSPSQVNSHVVAEPVISAISA